MDSKTKKFCDLPHETASYPELIQLLDGSSILYSCIVSVDHTTPQSLPKRRTTSPSQTTLARATLREREQAERTQVRHSSCYCFKPQQVPNMKL